MSDETPRPPAWTETARGWLVSLAAEMRRHLQDGEDCTVPIVLEEAEAIDATLEEIARLTQDNAELKAAMQIVVEHATDANVDAFLALQKPTKAVVCDCPGYETVKGPYPSGICRECGKWYPPKKAEASQCERAAFVAGIDIAHTIAANTRDETERNVEAAFLRWKLEAAP